MTFSPAGAPGGEPQAEAAMAAATSVAARQCVFMGRIIPQGAPPARCYLLSSSFFQYLVPLMSAEAMSPLSVIW